MFLEIPELLTAPEIQRLLAIAKAATFIDGRITNPGSTVKDNVQLDYKDGLYAESSRMLAAALQRSEAFLDFAFPKRMAPPMLTKYPVGKHYGLHSDAAFMPIGERPLRSDLSCTVFIAAPETYEGGALSVSLGTRRVAFKGAAGSAIVYPASTLHEVEPVASGERIVGLTFIESRVPDLRLRDLLYEINEIAAIEGPKMGKDSLARFERVQQNLHRMWSDPA